MLSASATIPCPANAASPWISSGRQRVRPRSETRSCLARTRPCTTVFTHSRWLGLNASDRCTLCASAPSPNVRSMENPRWYLTSPPLLRSVGVELVLELGEDLRRRLLQHVGEHVEPPAVSHADHDLDHVRARGALDQPLQQRDQALGALQREALVAQELVLQELLEHLGADHLREDLQPVGPRQRQPVARALHPVLQPRRAARRRAGGPARRRWCGSRSRAADPSDRAASCGRGPRRFRC